MHYGWETISWAHLMAGWQPLRFSVESREFSGLIKEPGSRGKKSLHIGKGLEFIQCAKERLSAGGW